MRPGGDFVSGDLVLDIKRLMRRSNMKVRPHKVVSST